MCLWLLTKALVLAAAYVHHVLQYNESLDHLQLTVCSRSGNDVNIPDSLPTLRQTKHHNNAYLRTISIWCWLLSFFCISLPFNPWWNHRAAVNYLASVIMPQAKTAELFPASHPGAKDGNFTCPLHEECVNWIQFWYMAQHWQIHTNVGKFWELSKPICKTFHW